MEADEQNDQTILNSIMRASKSKGDAEVHGRQISKNPNSSSSYYRSAEGVPFQWEMQPGTPINPPKDEALPPLSPPPSKYILPLQKPCIVRNIDQGSRLQLMKLKFLRLSKNHHGEHNITCSSGNHFLGLETTISNSSSEKCMRIPRKLTLSSSSSTALSKEIPTPVRCIPLRIHSMLWMHRKR